jgi:uncharacterized membrane protein YphA (DoxX/SURF4 family)
MRKKILFVISLLIGLMFINAGLNVFFNHMPPPTNVPEELLQMFGSMMQIRWLMPLLGAVQVLGGVLLIIPRFRALGAVVISPVIAGILLTHLTIAPEGLPFALGLFAIVIWLIVENREKYLPMIR